MPRTARKKSKTRISCDAQGVNRQAIFEDEEDAIKFLQILNKYGKKVNVKYMYV